MYILNFIRGFCMALADSVPGVSGGTIAFILGFYDSFVNALHNLISKDKIKRLKALKYLSKIGIGWVVGFILSVLFITSIFEKNIYEINSLFLGFIISSIPLIVKSEIKTKLLMTFKTSDDKKVSITVDNPREDLTETEIKEAMNTIIEKDIFSPNGGSLVSAVSAKVVQTDTTDYDLVL